jgi:hypothetical protein
MTLASQQSGPAADRFGAEADRHAAELLGFPVEDSTWVREAAEAWDIGRDAEADREAGQWMADNQHEIVMGPPPAGRSPWARQMYIDGADAAVDAFSASAEAQRASGDLTRLSETETWLALAREDQAAAVAGVDAEQLAAMGAGPVMTGPAPCCGYPEMEAGQ